MTFVTLQLPYVNIIESKINNITPYSFDLKRHLEVSKTLKSEKMLIPLSTVGQLGYFPHPALLILWPLPGTQNLHFDFIIILALCN